MEKIKTTDEYVIYKKRSGRHGVRSKKTRDWIHGEDKEKILLAEGLIQKSAPKPKAEEPAEGEGAAEEGGE